MALQVRTRRRLLAGGVVATLALVAVGQARPAALDPVRSAAGEVFGPAESLLTARDTTIETLTRQRDDARRQLAQRSRDAQQQDDLHGLQGALSRVTRFLPAQVVGFASDATTGLLQQITIDLGSADGIETNQAVQASAGLVGRTVSVSRHSSTVQLVTDPKAVVGARVGAEGALATVGNVTPPGLSARSPGLLTLTMVAGGTVRKGDQVRTLGSEGGRPYPAGIVVGQVVSVDPDRGQSGTTAVVRPAVDLARLDLVAVVMSVERATPDRILPGAGA
ncbi:rod shape-determining protein MreC [Flexivirga sp. ID2601S]|uniref:Cell shape-determining protein MreC n=1 Tax=Flexivirga aerilata TaxID=1656889 RepID=A0A849AM95_9MICO|nr:rod shape-determining protein MreC [Flexivirga aerilata]NNG39480.1 rod shape-determining protein MreC [Flexivirga aerilata]